MSGSDEASEERDRSTQERMLGLFSDVLREIGEQRRAFSESQLRTAEKEVALTKARQRLDRWKTFYKIILFGGPTLIGVLYFAYFVISTSGFQIGPFRDVVGVVDIKGEIMNGATAGADKVGPALRKAFESGRTKEIVLNIDSPGGAPGEAERIIAGLKSLKDKYPKRVTAVIQNIGASAAYMIAMHADAVVANRYSLVGSIGMILQGWDLHKAADKYEVAQRVYTSGPLKAMLHPLLPNTAEADAKAKALVAVGGATFLNDVALARPGKLKMNVNYATGEVWYGEEALALGLVDEMGTLESVLAKADLPKHNFGPTQSAGLFAATSDQLVAGVTDRLTGIFGFQLR